VKETWLMLGVVSPDPLYLIPRSSYVVLSFVGFMENPVEHVFFKGGKSQPTCRQTTRHWDLILVPLSVGLTLPT
jgi:hypothetical protein